MAGRILLVEGLNDQHVMWALFMAHRIPQTFRVETGGGDGGIDRLLESIPVRLKASDLERLGVIIDADENIQQRWDQLKARLFASSGMPVPDSPAPSGTIIQPRNGPRIGAWIMPDNRVSGMLETFLSFLVPDQDRLLPLVDQFLAGIPKEFLKFPQPRWPRARIHSWLALQEEPGKPLGQAITATYLDAQTGVVQPFLEWTRKMFVD